MGEFDLLDCYFTRPVSRNAMGVRDDCALVLWSSIMASEATTQR